MQGKYGPPLGENVTYDASGFYTQAPRPTPIAARIGQFGVSTLAMLAVFALLLIAIAYGLQRVGGLGAVASTPAPTATRVPTAVPAQGFTGFTGDVYSIMYPSSWTYSVKTQQTRVGTLHLDKFTDGQNLMLQVGTTDSIPSDHLQASLDPVAGAAVQGSLLQALAINQRRFYNKVEWLYSDYTQAVTNGNRQTMVEERVLTANFGTHSYFIILLAPKTSFASVDAASFEAMLRSFRFG